MASGVEEEGVRRGVAEDEEDDERPQLSAAAAMALREFLEQRQERDEGEKEEGDGDGVELVAEDWRLSQFWYDERTARELAEEVSRLASGLDGAAVACVACPTLYAYLKKSSPDVPAKLLEYDERFGQYGADFTFYDYNQPEELPPAMKHAYRIVVADPPYLSKECLERSGFSDLPSLTWGSLTGGARIWWGPCAVRASQGQVRGGMEKVAKTVSFLAPPEASFLLLLTGEVQKDRALELLNVRPCGFKPQHSNKLGNVFRLFTNYDPADRLGGWDRSDGNPV